MSAHMDTPPRNARAPVLFHVNGTGDRLLALPAVRAIARLYPGRLRIVGGPGDEQLFYSDLPLRDFRPLLAEIRQTHAVVDTGLLREALGDCDLLINFNTWHEPSVDAVLGETEGRETLGFFPQYKRWLPLSGSRHACDQFFDLVHLLEPSLRFEDFAQPPSLPPASTALARSFRAEVPTGVRLLAVHTETAAPKEWPLERFKRVLNDFLTRHPEWLVLVLDLADRGLASIPEGKRVVVASGLAIPPAMALVGVCDAFLGVDSCMMHAADFFQLPSVGLFGPTPEQRWGFRVTKHHRHISGAGSIDAIEEGVVAEALEELARRR